MTDGAQDDQIRLLLFGQELADITHPDAGGELFDLDRSAVGELLPYISHQSVFQCPGGTVERMPALGGADGESIVTVLAQPHPHTAARTDGDDLM